MIRTEKYAVQQYTEPYLHPPPNTPTKKELLLNMVSDTAALMCA
jgi:hypothetical protein